MLYKTFSWEYILTLSNPEESDPFHFPMAQYVSATFSSNDPRSTAPSFTDAFALTCWLLYPEQMSLVSMSEAFLCSIWASVHISSQRSLSNHLIWSCPLVPDNLLSQHFIYSLLSRAATLLFLDFFILYFSCENVRYASLGSNHVFSGNLGIFRISTIGGMQ